MVNRSVFQTSLTGLILAYAGDPETTACVNKTWKNLWDSNYVLRSCIDNFESQLKVDSTCLMDLPRILIITLEENPTNPTALKIFQIMKNHKSFYMHSVKGCANPRTLSILVSNNGLSLRGIDLQHPNLHNNARDIVLIAVQQNGLALRDAERYQDDEDVADKAYAQNSESHQFVSQGLHFRMEG